MKFAFHVGMLGLISGALGALGCASDDVRLPEAEMVTPGAFIAVEGYDTEREITLIRTIDRLDFQFETLLFFSTYDVAPTTFTDATEFAKKPELPLRTEIDAQPLAAIREHRWQVVWFRTLTEEEQRRVE
jgi:hypothetical protein